MKKATLVTSNYRDRWSKLPEGEFDLEAGEIVDFINNPGIGSIHVRKLDGTDVYVAGFSGYILKPYTGTLEDEMPGMAGETMTILHYFVNGVSATRETYVITLNDLQKAELLDYENSISVGNYNEAVRFTI